jgi:hypothetical protein
LDEREDDHEVELEHDEAAHQDENSLAFILQRAVAEISELGGRKRHRLSQVLGRQNYDKLMSVAKAINDWEGASDKTKSAASRLLAVHIARAAETPELVGRLQREIQDASEDYFDTGKSRETSSKTKTIAAIIFRHPRQPKSKNTAMPSISGKPDKRRATNHQKEPTSTRSRN